MEADIAARKMEIGAELKTGLLKDGINATAWNALRKQIELTAMGATQSAEKTKLEQELGATTSQQGAIAGATREYQTEAKRQTALKEAATALNAFTNIGQQFATADRQYKLEEFRLGAHTTGQQNANISGRVAEWAAENPNTANIVSNLIPVVGQLSNIGGYLTGNNGIGGALDSATGGEQARRQLREGITIDGQQMNYDNALNMSDIGSGFASGTPEQIRQRNEADAAALESSRNIANNIGVMDSILGTTDLKLTQIDANIAGLMHDSKMQTIRTGGEMARADIEVSKNYQIGMSNAQTQQQLSNIWANQAASEAKIRANEQATIEKRWIDAAKKVEEAWLELAQKMEEFVGDWQQMTNDFGVSMGYIHSAQLQSFEKTMFQTIRDNVSQYGVDMEKYLEMRSGYINATNRNIQFTGADDRQMSAFYKVMGKDSGIVAEYTGAMEVFNHGINESVNSIDKAMQSANKIGLNGRKFVKEVTQNLKLAQKYNFKEGTQGLMKMTEWAMKTRFNMQSLGSMIDKILDGGLEGVIEQSSRLQVLGGNAAIYSDPFSMMYNAGADPAALAEQFQNMTKGMGSIDRKTGETTFNWNENMMLREIAKNQGRDVSDVMDEIRARNRRESVQLAMTAEQKANFKPDQLDYMGNLAHYSKEKGGFAVNVYKGNGEFEEKGINEIRPEDIKNLQPQEHEERMENYVLDIRSGMEKITGEEVRQKADIGLELYDEYMKQMTERSQKAYDEYAKNRDEYITNIKTKWGEATSVFGDMIRSLKTDSNGMDEATNRAASSVNSFAQAVEEATSRINIASGVGNGNGHSNGGGASVNDAYVSGNGRPFFGKASNITPINDGFIANPADEGLIGKRGGWVDTLVNGMYSMISNMYRGNGNMNININGSLRLESNGQSIDLISEMRNNPLLVREVTSMIFRQGSMNINGGKGSHPWNDNSGNTYYN